MNKYTAFAQQKLVARSAVQKFWQAVKIRQWAEPMELAISPPLSQVSETLMDLSSLRYQLMEEVLEDCESLLELDKTTISNCNLYWMLSLAQTVLHLPLHLFSSCCLWHWDERNDFFQNCRYRCSSSNDRYLIWWFVPEYFQLRLYNCECYVQGLVHK